MTTTTWSSLSVGILLVSLVALPSCKGASGGAVTYDARPTIIVLSKDAALVAPDAGAADVPVNPPETQVVPVDGALVDKPTTPSGPVDTGSVAVCIDPSTLFPTCQGTADEISDCITNLPTRSGTPVTRPDPVDYSTCRP